MLRLRIAIRAMLRPVVDRSTRRSRYWEASPAHSKFGSVVRLVLCALATLTCSLAAVPTFADEFVELHIPLRESSFYQARDFYAECNRKLGTDYSLDEIDGRMHELTVFEKLMLMWFSQAFPEIGQMRIEGQTLIVRLPASRDARVGQQQSRKLGQMLGLRQTAWPAGRGLLRPDEIEPRKRTVLLVHGLNANAKACENMARAFAAYGVQTLLFDYPDYLPIADIGKRLHADLTQLAAEYPDLKLIIVAHSMGGLVSRAALEGNTPVVPCVTDLFMLGTPHQGSRLAVGQPWLDACEIWKTALSLRIRRANGAGVFDGMNAAAGDLRPGSEFLRELGRGPRPAGIRYHVAAGRKGFFTPEEHEEVIADLEHTLQQRDVPLLVQAGIMEFGSAPELRSGRGDGAVTLQSALLPGADNSRVFDLSHTELLAGDVQPPESSDVFRWIVEVMQWSRANGN